MSMEFFNLSGISNSDGADIELHEIDSKDIAIIGISAQMPLADDTDEYWENILNGLECVREFPIERKSDADKYLRFTGTEAEQIPYNKAAYLENISAFDPKKFNLSPKEAKMMDPRQRLFLQQTSAAIEDAGYHIQELRGKRIGVYSGFSDLGGTKYFDILTNVNPDFYETGLTGNLQAIIPSRVSYLLDLKGPSVVVDTACSSSLVAVHLACQAIRNGECESAIVGSVRIHLLPVVDERKIGIETRDGSTRAFDNGATGTGIGEGAISIFLKPLYKAKEDGDHVYAVIKGTAINQDGNSIGISAPNADAQADVIERAWKDAGVSAEDISYIEAHGTGTILGDPIEIDGISKAFSKYTMKKQLCAISSVKNNIGHLYDASGLASVIKCLYALNKKMLPPTINYNIPNKAINFSESPVYVNMLPRKWESKTKKRICGINSFGFSGTNCHIVLEEAEADDEKQYEEHSGSYILTLSGETEEVLRKLVQRYVYKIDQIRKYNPKDVCFTASVGRNHYKQRLAVIFSDYDQLEKLLTEFMETTLEEVNNPNIYCNLNRDAEEEDSAVDMQLLNKFNLNDRNIGQDLKFIANTYVNNQKIQWTELYASTKRNRVRLPSAVFQEQQYWIDIPENPIKFKEGESLEFLTNNQDDIKLTGRSDGAYTDTEKKLGEIIKSALEFEELNVYENFYDFGGDSILVIDMFSKINECFQINLSAADIFSYPSIFRLAQYVDGLIVKEQESKQSVSNGYENGEVSDEIAIIGMAGKFPFSNDLEQYWNNIISQKNCVGQIPEQRKDDLARYIRQIGLDIEQVQYEKAGYLSEIDKFDYEFFNVSFEEATLMDPVQRNFLEIVHEAIEEAGYGGERLSGSDTGVFVGYAEDYTYSYRRFINDSDPSLTKLALAGNLASLMAGRVSYIYDLKGPSLVIDTACSSSLVALNAAIKSIRNGECKSAIVGGAKIKLIPVYKPESEVGVTSRSFKICAFDDNANGIVEGEAVCAILIKPLKQAVKDGDHIHAVIKGSATNQDGTGMGVMAPRADTQTNVLVKAWEDAKIDPSTITYIEAHGTGTKLGDLVEYEALKNAFELYTDRSQFCALSSVKTNLGHTYQASGITSVIKAALSLKHEKIVPTINFNRPNRLMNLEESALYVNDTLRDWETEEGIPRRCGISSFGLSGTNCHVVLEEYKDDSGEIVPIEKKYIVTISGRDEEDLHNLVVKYHYFIKTNHNVDMKKFSYTTNVGRGHYNERLAIVVSNQDELRAKLEQLLAKDWKSKHLKNVFYGKLDQKLTIPVELENYEEFAGFDASQPMDELSLNRAGALYVIGKDVEWEKFYGDYFNQVMSIPTYPFKRNRCWFQPKGGYISKVFADDEIIENTIEVSGKNTNFEVGDKLGYYNNDVERIVLEAVENVIGTSAVSLDDNFFELGGDSFKATLLVSKIYELLEVLITLTDILRFPTIGKLAEYLNVQVEDNVIEDNQIIPVLPPQEMYDLSYKQLDLWLSTKVYKGASALNITWACNLYNFDIELFYQSLEAVINRHSIMKTKIVVEDGIPKQTIEGSMNLADFYRYIDLSNEEDVDAAIKQVIKSEVGQQIPLENGPLVRITVAKRDNNSHALVFVINHMISDWWSMDVIINDLKNCYRAARMKLELEWKPLSIKYTDYSDWQRKKIENNSTLKRYWDNILTGPLPVLNMKTDFERPLVKGQVGNKLIFKLDQKYTDKLKNISEVNQGTMFMSLLTSVYTLLHLYSGQHDIIVGTNTAGREHPQLQNQVGYFVNVVPLRLHIDGDDTYTQLFEKVQKIMLGAIEHQDYPFILMLENESVVRESSRSPIFDVLVQYLNDPNSDGIVVDEARIEEIPYDSLESKYDLVFNFIEKHNQIVLELEYSNSLFKAETMHRMIARLKEILKEFSENQQTPIRKVGIVNMQEKEMKIVKRKRR
ncbi:hypothetical protein BK784_08890 [Bacillus thuringiensis serovar medellin]|uniref:Polyketide synthase n=2 Tax=Bacillus thuringiensis TaxID=1428 RepID=A0A9X6N7D8_BACTV|nr:hypothetical protein BK784_08890 [Bacillus thuringiensis serovar medellin]